MAEHPRDEFDEVPEDGTRQGVHRGHNPQAAQGSARAFAAVVTAGVIALGIGAVSYVNAPRTAVEAGSITSTVQGEISSSYQGRISTSTPPADEPTRDDHVPERVSHEAPAPVAAPRATTDRRHGAGPSPTTRPTGSAHDRGDVEREPTRGPHVSPPGTRPTTPAPTPDPSVVPVADPGEVPVVVPGAVPGAVPGQSGPVVQDPSVPGAPSRATDEPVTMPTQAPSHAHDPVG